MRGIMAATGDSYGCNSDYEPPFEECMQLLMGHSTSRSRKRTPSALGLQLLVVRGDYFKEQFAKLSEQLVWLRWYDFPHGKLPSWLSMGNLRVLELKQPKRVAELWGPNDVPPSQLRELIIKNSFNRDLLMIPETIRVLKHLKKIVLTMIHVPSLREEFCLLESLEHLDLSDSELRSLPTHFGKLGKLKYINLNFCSKLTALPVSFNQLTELKYLYLSWCRNLHIEKNILENIRKLEILDLDGCSKLQQLPSEITRQMYLRVLRLSGTGLRELPADIDSLANLEVLELGGLLTGLPNSLRNLSSLIRLRISDCRGLKLLPHMGCLTRLEHLELSYLDVEYLQGFGQQVNLQNLQISHCPMRELPLANSEERHSKNSSMFKFLWLKLIKLDATKVSTISISEDCCPCLEDLTLSQNEDLLEIETLPTKLKRLQIRSCKKLENISVVAGLAELQLLEIGKCSGLDELPSFAGLVKLQSLRIEECLQLHVLPSFAALAELQFLGITKCSGLDELPSFAGLVKLQNLHIEECLQLHVLPSFAALVKLRVCFVDKCPEIDELPTFACCTYLEYLSINVSNRLMKIEGIEELRSLKQLHLKTSWKIPGIKSLKNLDKLTRLQIRAERRSAIETCISPNIVKRGCEMDIVGMAVENVDSVGDSLSFPNLTVVDKLHSRSDDFDGEWWATEIPLSNASCVIGCFVVSCSSQEGPIDCGLHSRGGTILRPISFLKLKGKQVHICVWPKDFHLNLEETEFLRFEIRGDVQIEKGMAMTIRNGEEEKTFETLHKFLELLER